MSRRKILAAATTMLIGVGILFVAIPFVASFDRNPRGDSESWIEYDLSGLAPGSILQFDLGFAYRRTARDFESYEISSELRQPGPSNVATPPEADNEFRSSDPAVLIAFSQTPNRYCDLEFRESYSYPEYSWPDAIAMSDYPHFFEPCDGRVYDTTGRILARESYPREDNLRLPRTDWLDEDRVLIRWVE